MERDDLSMLVAHNIEALMRARNLDAAKLARLSKVNPTGVYDILSGKSRSPRLETVSKIAEGLGVPLAMIFERQPVDSMKADLLALFDHLPSDQKALLIQTARAWQPEAKAS